MTKTIPDCDIVMKRLHLYYDMKLVTFGIDRKRNFIIQFPVFIQLYTQQPMILYQLETVPVPVIGRTTKADAYKQHQIKQSYTEIYINIRQQENRLWILLQRLFVVGHKSRYSCKSGIYFDLDKEIVKQNCEFKFYYNKEDVTPTVCEEGMK